jgi:phytoene dehydrogenase-like protein
MTADVVVIGSGIGGLSCAALLARYGLEVVVCESHTIAGGAAHAFERQGFHFDSGPSLHSGMSHPSANPLRQVLDALEVDLDWATYDAWGCCLPEGDFRMAVGAEPFCEVLKELRGSQAVQEWRQLQQVMDPLKQASVAIPPAAVRFDWGALVSVGRYAPNLLGSLLDHPRLTGPFSALMQGVVRDPFIRNWLDLLCFMLSGLPADGTSAAEMAFMFADWYRPDVILDYPIGGSGALVQALVQGLKKWGGHLRLGAHVEQILVENQRAVGVQLRHGEVIRAREAVVSNASIWDTLSLLPPRAVPQRWRQQQEKTPACDSFMHLHLGIKAEGLPADLDCHYLVVNDWERGVTAPQNVIAISIPSLLDPALAPPGYHNIHVYTPATEPFHLWQDLERRSPAYAQLKQERAEPMWQALERIMPDIRERCELTLVGTPLTHARFLRRHRGSYGPAWRAGEQMFPGPRTPLAGLLCCGDSTFPGIGLPAVAASGMIAANTLAPLDRHLRLLSSLHL